jgi:hypothetical protein
VKCVVRAAPKLAHDGGKARSVFKDMGAELRRYRRAYTSTSYVVRIYAYVASHLAPAPSLLSDGGNANEGCQAYLVVSNGTGRENNFSGKEQVQERCLDMDPEFYQVIELRAVLPENGIVKVQVYDKAAPMAPKFDRFIGETSIDIEARVLAGEPKGPREWLGLTRPGFATSRGKV